MRLNGLAALAALSAVVSLSACERAKKPAEAPAPTAPAAPVLPTGFQHEPGFDAQGYYRSETTVQSGNYKLDHMSMGAPSDFQAWEGGAREGVFGPIWIHFDDVTSPKATNELGQETHTVRIRVEPLSYRMGPGQMTFHGKDERLGDVVFDGAFDTAALAQARGAGSSEGRPVLNGSLQVGGERIRNISFGYWAGD